MTNLSKITKQLAAVMVVFATIAISALFASAQEGRVNLKETNITLGVGQTAELKDLLTEGTDISLLTFISQKDDIVTADNENGTLIAVSEGEAVVDITYADGEAEQLFVAVQKAPTTVSLNKTNLTLGVGESFALNASVNSDEFQSDIAFESSDASIASVNSNGSITANGAGTATITATTYNGKTAQCTVTVKNAPTYLGLNKTSITLGVGEVFDLNSKLNSGEYASIISFSTSSKDIADVTYYKGYVTAKKAGTATITATTYNGKTAQCTVTVKNAPTSLGLNKTSITLGVGEMFDLNSKLNSGEYASIISFSTSSKNIADVTYYKGYVTAKKAGTATITATTYNGKTAQCTVTVKNAPTTFTLSKSSAVVYLGEKLELGAKFKSNEFSNAVKFTSSANSIAVVDANSGVVTAKKIGTATITATTFNGKKAVCKITVKKAPLTLKINKASVTLGYGERFALTVKYSDNTPSKSVTYTSSNKAVAEVSSAGVIKAKALGTATITAKTPNGSKITCKVTVQKLPTNIGLYEKCIDVSTWNGIINWQKVYNSGIRYAMIRSSFGRDEPNQVDNKFVLNAKNAGAAGIKFGVYHYSYATSVADAKKEAQFCLKTIKGYKLSLPVAFDIEDDSLKYLGKKKLTDITLAFCDTIKAAGYTPVVYCNLDWYKNYLDGDKIAQKYDIWLAQWFTDKPGTSCSMWQYADNGKVSGIDGYVDLNYIFRDFAQKLIGTASNTYKITKQSVLRANPWIDSLSGGTSSKILASLKEGAKVTWVSDNKNGWSKVKYNGITGYVQNTRINKTGLSKYKKATVTANTKIKYVSKQSVTQTIKKNAQVTVVAQIQSGKNKGYSYISYNGKDYYIQSKYIKIQ